MGGRERQGPLLFGAGGRENSHLRRRRGMLVFQGTPAFVYSQNGKGTLPRRSLAMGSIPEGHWKLPEGRGRGEEGESQVGGWRQE